MLQQPAERLLATNVGRTWHIVGRCGQLCERRVAKTLVRPFDSVMPSEFRDDMIQMALAQHEKMIKRLALNRLNPSLDVRFQVRRPTRDVEAFHTTPGQGGVERSAVLRIPIVVDALAREAVRLDMPAKGFRLRRAPYLAWVQRGGRHEDTSRADINKGQDE